MSFTERVYMDVVHKRLDGDNISPSNKKYIREHDLILSAKGIKKARRKKYIDILRWWTKILNMDLKKTTKDDLIKAVDKLQSDTLLTKKGTPFSDASKETNKAILKTFYKWLEGNDELFPEKIRWLKPKVSALSNKLPKDIFTEQDIQIMLQFANSARDQAIIMVLYESGVRASEFLGLKIRDITQEQKGMRMFVDGKTGRRSFLLVSCIPYIMRYLNTHPDKNNPDAPVWFSNHRKGLQTLSYETVKHVIKTIGKAAKISKPMHPHNFRHSAETRDAKFMTDSQLAYKYGHVPGSAMVRKYVHLSGKDTDTAILKYYGLATQEDQISQFTPKTCKTCGYDNPQKVDYCERCGRAISHKAINEDKQETKKELVAALKALLKESPELGQALKEAAE
jgi:site-specific recombinase XerD/predicted Zn-ribbon and HTH transcriptional regulator